MKNVFRSLVVSFLALFAGVAAAQPPQPQSGPFPQAQLDAMLAPIALYPDSLLSQVLMAASYPRDVADAARWSHERPGLAGAEAVRAAQDAPWDPSVVSLVAFPQILAMMAQRPEWTDDLGRAFVSQSREVMDTVQQLRARADAAGTLQSNEQMVVERQGYDYVIEPASPEVVYVPYYDPRYAYGRWWWADYPPVYWNPWPGYSYAYGYGGLGWGYGITIGSGFWFSSLDWRHRYAYYSQHRPWYHRGDFRHGDRWRHDGTRRWTNYDGRPRDGSRDGRWRDGQRDGQRDRPRNQVTRPPAPVYSNSAVPGQRPTYRSERDAPPVTRGDATAIRREPVQGAPVMQQRVAPQDVQQQRAASVERPVRQRVERAPVERAAPVERVAPVQRAAPERAPRAERAAPERARESSDRDSADRNPAERGSRSMQR
jgi:hypothetical protein